MDASAGGQPTAESRGADETAPVVAAAAQTSGAAASPADAASWSPLPAWLRTLVVPQTIEPPVDTRDQVLPFERLAWENFERLCLKLALSRGTVDHADDHTASDHETGRMSAHDARAQGGLYGTRGQDQQGIDLYVRLPPGPAPSSNAPERKYLCLQSRRIQSLTPAKLAKAVSDFLEGSWAVVSRVFVYATSLPLVRTELADEVKSQMKRLAAEGIAFEVWDAEALSDDLKLQHRLVDDFFGRPWVRRFCGDDAADALGSRLDAVDVGAFREKLGGFYQTFFDVVDSGTAALQRPDAPSLGLRDRFVLPDVAVSDSLGRVPAGEPQSQSLPSAANAMAAGHSESAGELYAQLQALTYGRAASVTVFHAESPDQLTVGVYGTDEGGAAVSSLAVTGAVSRMRADAWLASSDRLVLVGGPGSGKSAFLRYAVLDLFAPDPTMTGWVERFGDRLPVWLPFHFFTRRRAHHDGAEASLESTMRAWFDQQDAGHLWPLMGKALADDRLLLIVDGLDEWIDETAGRSAATALEVYLGTRNVPAVVSSRPYGLDRLGLSGRWTYARLASLSGDQQRHLAGLWFTAAGVMPPTALASDSDYQGGLRVDGFMRDIHGLPELRELAQVPLFLLLLIGLRLAGVQLPSRRFDVYERVIDQLLRHHPAKRVAAASASVTQVPLPEDDIRQILGYVAYLHQYRGEFGPVPEATVRHDVKEALQAPDHRAMSAQSAADHVHPFVDVAEGQLGILVRQGPRELGFLHRVLLEQLAAEHAVNRLSDDELLELFRQKASDPRWKDVLLGVLWRSRRPKTVAQLTDVVAAQARGEMPADLDVRELLAEIAFGAYRLPASDASRHAQAVLDAIETHPYFPHRARLLSAVMPGLEDPTVGGPLQERLRRWTLARLPLPPGAYYHLGRVLFDERIEDKVLGVLLAALADEQPATAQVAAIAIANRYPTSARGDQGRTALIDAARRPLTAQHAAMALMSLLLGWADDEQVQQLLATARRQTSASLRLVSLAASLGILRSLVVPGEETTSVSAISEAATDEDRTWLERQIDNEDHFRSHWVPFIAEALVAAKAGNDEDSMRLRDRCLRILTKGSNDFGDRSIAWTVLMRGYAQDPAVLSFVRHNMLTDLSGVRFFGFSQLVAAYPDNAFIARCIEDALKNKPLIMEPDLHTLAAIDHGPVIRGLLLARFAERSAPHWAADALANYWADDATVRRALQERLADDPPHASQIANVAVRVLGAAKAIERLLNILEHRPTGESRLRRDIVVYALLEACTNLGETSGQTAERLAEACLNALDDPEDPSEADAEVSVVATLPSTPAARARAEAMLQRRLLPAAALLAAYGQEPATLTAILERLTDARPQLPAPVRQRLCTLLRYMTSRSAIIRELTRDWPAEPDDLVRSAASAAYHTHLRQAHQDATVNDAEWDAALAVLRREALASGYDNGGRRRSAWLGALLLGELALLDDLRERHGAQLPAQLRLGELVTTTDMQLLAEIADQWPQLRDHFGGALLQRLGGASLRNDTKDVWNYLALVAERQPMLQRELSETLAEDQTLLEHDGVLAWYARTHRGEPQLLQTLIARLGRDGSNARPLPSLLLGRPETLGLDSDIVATELRRRFEPEMRWLPVDQSEVLEALADAAPADDMVRHCWEAFVKGRDQGRRVGMHARTYFPLAYAAVATADLVAQLHQDIERMSTSGRSYFEPQFVNSATRRLSRDAGARGAVEVCIRNQNTCDQQAAQLASLLASVHPLSSDTISNLMARLGRQLSADGPDAVHDCVSGADGPVHLLLLGVLSGYAVTDVPESAA